MLDRRNPLWFQPDDVPDVSQAEMDERLDLESLDLLAEAHELALDDQPDGRDREAIAQAVAEWAGGWK